MTLPPAIIHVLVTMSLLCNLSLAPTQPPYIPDEESVVALAQTLYGECRGCSEIQQKAVCWCVFNRVDDGRFPDSIIGVVSAPHQFAGYKASFPVTDELYDLARECIIDWHNGENRVLEPGFCFFYGNGRINIFSTEYGGKGQRWEEE